MEIKRKIPEIPLMTQAASAPVFRDFLLLGSILNVGVC